MKIPFKKLNTGDILINANGEIIKVDSGTLEIFRDGSYNLSKDGHLMFVDKDEILSAQSQHNQIIDLSDLIKS